MTPESEKKYASQDKGMSDAIKLLKTAKKKGESCLVFVDHDDRASLAVLGLNSVNLAQLVENIIRASPEVLDVLQAKAMYDRGDKTVEELHGTLQEMHDKRMSDSNVVPIKTRH